jgi:DNA repair protein RadC
MYQMLASPKLLERLDRPREKLQSKGVQALSEIELLEVIIGSGIKGVHVGQLATQVVQLLHDKGAELSLGQLLKIKGLSLAKACSVLAAIELSHRLDSKELMVRHPLEVLPLVAEYATKRQEHLICFSLNGAGKIIATRVVTVGTLTNTLIHPREVFTDPIADRAAAIILVHNHPSGDPSPSNADIQITRRLVQAGKLLGVEVEDHIIVTPEGRHTSLRQAGYMDLS